MTFLNFGFILNEKCHLNTGISVKKMNFDRLKEKLEILADAAKYDVSCSSSGGTRKNKKGALGDSSVSGICHTYTEDGRCVSLLKIL